MKNAIDQLISLKLDHEKDLSPSMVDDRPLTAAEIYLEAAIRHMDDDLREEIHGNHQMYAHSNDEEFLTIYCHLHFNKFAEEFVVN